LLQSSTN